MIKFLFPIFCFFLSQNIYSLELRCKFEEVYSDGSVQQGFFLIKGKNFRYQYEDKKLFTIFKSNDNYFIVENIDKNNFKKLNNNNEILKKLINIINDYPNLNDTYKDDSLLVNMEKSNINNFYKRISIQSNQVNLSIYLNQCEFLEIADVFLSHNPSYKYNYE